jgi:hypothetical protein
MERLWRSVKWEEAYANSYHSVRDANGVPLVSGRATTVPGLYFCGFHNDTGGLLRQIGREAQQIAREIANKREGHRRRDEVQEHPSALTTRQRA